MFVEPRGRLWAPPCSHRRGYTSGCRAVIRRQQSQHPVGSTSLKYLPLAAGVVNFTYSLLTGLPIGRVELCLVSIRLCLVLYASLVVAIPLRLLTRATSFYGCAQHLTWRRLQQRTCAPNAPYGTGKPCPLSSRRISRNSWAGRLAPRAPEMRGTCAPRCERDRVCLGMGLAGCPQYQDTSSVTQEEGFWNASVARGMICCFMGGRVLPRAVLTCFPPSDRPHSRHLFPEKEARVGSLGASRTAPKFGPHRPIAWCTPPRPTAPKPRPGYFPTPFLSPGSPVDREAFSLQRHFAVGLRRVSDASPGSGCELWELVAEIESLYSCA